MRILKIFGGIVATILLCVTAAFVAARFHDGPLAIIPGGPLSSGELVSSPVSNWSFAASIQTVELQLSEDAGLPPGGAGVWFFEVESRAS